MITEIKPQFSERQMWEQQAQPIIASSGLQSRNEHIMQRLHDIVIAIQTIETYAIEKCVDDYEVKEEWVCEMADLVELYHELNFDKFIQNKTQKQ